LYVIAVLYFVLLQFFWSQLNITRAKDQFSEKQKVSIFRSPPFYLNSHYLCAIWSQKENDWNNDIFLFLYEMYREKCCSISCCMFDCVERATLTLTSVCFKLTTISSRCYQFYVPVLLPSL